MNVGEQTTMDSTLATNMEEAMSASKAKKSVPHIDKLVINAVVSKLGKPKNLDFIRASNVFDNRWRVDVWGSHDSTTTDVVVKYSKIDYSYFIRYDEEAGQIISCDPEIEPIKEKDNERVQK